MAKLKPKFGCSIAWRKSLLLPLSASLHRQQREIMSIGYLEHSKTRYLRNHYEIYDYRKEKEAQALEQAAARQKVR